MRLGAFSVSLSVKNLEVSKAFYEALGFTVFGGDIAQNYLILKNESAVIGLFQGMFTHNLLTFNPGWNTNAEQLADFDDVRTIQTALQAKGIPIAQQTDKNTSGPASITLFDPDGNAILIDQHV